MSRKVLLALPYISHHIQSGQIVNLAKKSLTRVCNPGVWMEMLPEIRLDSTTSHPFQHYCFNSSVQNMKDPSAVNSPKFPENCSYMHMHGEKLYIGTFSNRNKYLSGGYWEQPFAKPYFENSTKREVTTTVGQTAYLHCRVRNLGDRAVSWIRKRDLHILTVGILTYTSDQRFQSLHSDGTDEWTLKVSSPQIRDSGTYECQVSTEPKISMAYQLNVVVSQAEILGNPELHLKSGSDINLTCIVRQTPEPPTFIYWYHGRRVINYSQRGGKDYFSTSFYSPIFPTIMSPPSRHHIFPNLIYNHMRIHLFPLTWVYSLITSVATLGV
ncbi:unnamed protein product [Allacma fusca]|uniref:Ig-like domain-containing protein n=1 Tax=Allacma fusca TaxID=39272 RepID=A0A8J2KX78_9HEXA|nr:unnamed protein product [Allacma fusca]